MTDHIKERKRIALAMGWHLFQGHWQPPSVTPEQCQSFHDEGRHINWRAYGLIDPFTDANDDYAVLEWMREEYPEGTTMHRAIGDGFYSDEWGWPYYEVGDYARAALKVLTEGDD